MKIVITGAAGQLGRDLVATLSRDGHEVSALGRTELDVTSAEQVRTRLIAESPDLVVNSAAENRVDACESALEEAFAVNAIAPGRLAAISTEMEVPLLHVSTDYVFDGHKHAPYLESDQAMPLSAYGLSKLAGEILVRQRNPHHYIVRTSGLYGPAASQGETVNFVEAILRRARSDGHVDVVDDQTTAPTYTADLAVAVASLIESDDFGTYHIAADGEVTWHDFARAILELSDVSASVRRIKTGDLGLAAPRPAYSVLRSEKLSPLRAWRDALVAYMSLRQARRSTG